MHLHRRSTSHLPSKKELLEIKKAKELQQKLAAEDTKKVIPTTAPTMSEQSTSTTMPTPNKRKNPTSDDGDEGFITGLRVSVESFRVQLGPSICWNCRLPTR
ncbi:hypothetical protein CDAR_111951 [Caerostris darwini]|uniref:Uncharacterized protein n=1 Tax=Caerostris darwini TaxID=1538125 RepID=A0AAV4PQT9_9ARAC|nr:hypothetical protein CDAR_111951 [Caerostris darwini]